MHLELIAWLLILGIAAGVSTGLPYGPVGFVIIRRFYLFGMGSGMYSALGSVAADAFYAIVVGFSLHRISHFLLHIATYAELVAGIALIYIGVRSMRQKLHLHHGDEENHPVEDMTSAAILNGLNPTLIFSFGLVFTIMNSIVHGIRLSAYDITIFILGIVLGTCGLWYVLGRGIQWLRKNNRDQVVQKINFATGVILTVLGLGVLVLAIIRFF